MSSDDRLQQLKDEVFNSNKKVAPRAVLLSLAINAALSVRSSAGDAVPCRVVVNHLCLTSYSRFSDSS